MSALQVIRRSHDFFTFSKNLKKSDKSHTSAQKFAIFNRIRNKGPPAALRIKTYLLGVLQTTINCDNEKFHVIIGGSCITEFSEFAHRT
jgi:hypothetical protein